MTRDNKELRINLTAQLISENRNIPSNDKKRENNNT